MLFHPNLRAPLVDIRLITSLCCIVDFCLIIDLRLTTAMRLTRNLHLAGDLYSIVDFHLVELCATCSPSCYFAISNLYFWCSGCNC
jgi:hypothetical protein